MRSEPQVGMVVCHKMDENSEKMPHRMVVTKVIDNNTVEVANPLTNGFIQIQSLPTAALEKYNKKRYSDGI